MLFSCEVMSLCNPIEYSAPSSPVHHCLLELLKFISIGLVMPSNHLILCRPLFSSCSPSFPASGVFCNDLTLHIRWPEYWSFSISPSTEYSGLISFRIDSFDLLVWISFEMSPVLHRVEDLVWVTDGGILRQVQLREGCPSGVPSVSLACWQVQIVPLAGAQLTV